MAVDAREAGDERLAVRALELVERAAVDQPRDDLAHVVGLVDVDRHDAVQIGGIDGGRRRSRRRPTPVASGGGQGRDDVAHDLERVLVVLGEVVDDAGAARVQLSPAELLGGDDLADRGLHERRSAEEDRALVAHDHRLVAHRRHVGAAGGARAEHRGDLRDALGRHPRLVEEDAPEVVAIGEDLVLHRQERAAGVDEVDAGKPVLERDLLRAQVLLHRERVVRAALDGRVVADDHHLAAVHQPDARDHPGAGRVAAVHALGGERRDLDERAALVEEPRDAVAGQELAAGDVAFARGGGAADGCLGEALAKVPRRARPGRRACARTRRRARPRSAVPSPAAVMSSPSTSRSHHVGCPVAMRLVRVH